MSIRLDFYEVRPGDQVVVDSTVAALVGAVAFPAVTFLLTTTAAAAQTEQRLFYWQEALAVELAVEASGGYHLRALESGEQIYQRFLVLWELSDQPAAPGERMALPESAWVEAGRLALETGATRAQAVLTQAGVPEPAAHILAETLATCRRNGGLAAIRRGEVAWQTDGFGLLKGANGLWLLRSIERNGQPWLQVIPTDAPTLTKITRKFMAEYGVVS